LTVLTIHFLLFIVLYFIGVCMSVYNCGLTVVLLKRHFTFDLIDLDMIDRQAWSLSPVLVQCGHARLC